MDAGGKLMRGMQEETAARFDALVGPIADMVLAIRWQDAEKDEHAVRDSNPRHRD